MQAGGVSVPRAYWTPLFVKRWFFCRGGMALAASVFPSEQPAGSTDSVPSAGKAVRSSDATVRAARRNSQPKERPPAGGPRRPRGAAEGAPLAVPTPRQHAHVRRSRLLTCRATMTDGRADRPRWRLQLQLPGVPTDPFGRLPTAARPAATASATSLPNLPPQASSPARKRSWICAAVLCCISCALELPSPTAQMLAA